MATVTITFPANTGANVGFETGAQIRGLAKKLTEAASALSDRVNSGASVTLVFDDTTVGSSPGLFTLSGGSLPAAVSKRI